MKKLLVMLQKTNGEFVALSVEDILYMEEDTKVRDKPMTDITMVNEKLFCIDMSITQILEQISRCYK